MFSAEGLWEEDGKKFCWLALFSFEHGGANISVCFWGGAVHFFHCSWGEHLRAWVLRSLRFVMARLEGQGG